MNLMQLPDEKEEEKGQVSYQSVGVEIEGVSRCQELVTR